MTRCRQSAQLTSHPTCTIVWSPATMPVLQRTPFTCAQQKAAAGPSLRPMAVIGRRAVQCRAQQAPLEGLSRQAAAGAAAAMLTLGSFSGAALANEFDILGEPVPTKSYYVDDANVLSRSTRSELNKRLSILETQTGYRLEVVTVRKLEFETDAFAFADKVLENWYPTREEGDKKGVLLVVSSGKEGAITGGPSFMKSVGDELIDSIVTDNIPIYTEDEKYNAATLTSVDRLEAQLSGQPVPDAPKRNDGERVRTYRTKEETEKSKPVTATVVGVLLFIAVAVPMLQYYGYTARD